jgi:hypothetical protein
MKTVVVNVYNAVLKVPMYDSDVNVFRRVRYYYETYVVNKNIETQVVFAPSEDKLVFDINEGDTENQNKIIDLFQQCFDSGIFLVK